MDCRFMTDDIFLPLLGGPTLLLVDPLVQDSSIEIR